MAQRKLECVEVIQIKDAVQKFGIYGDKIIVLTQKKVLKVHICILCSQEFVSTNDGMCSSNNLSNLNSFYFHSSLVQQEVPKHFTRASM